MVSERKQGQRIAPKWAEMWMLIIPAELSCLNPLPGSALHSNIRRKNDENIMGKQ